LRHKTKASYSKKEIYCQGLRVFDGKASPLFFAVFGCFVRRSLEGGLKGYRVVIGDICLVANSPQKGVFEEA
jgi:hypothetical protein